MYTRAWWESHPFPHVPCGEDVAFAQEAMAAREMAVADDLGLMYATIHAGIPTAGWNLRNGCECPVCLTGGNAKSATANTSHRQITPGSTWELIPSAEAMYNRLLVTA
jgi:hypothetical protein